MVGASANRPIRLTQDPSCPSGWPPHPFRVPGPCRTVGNGRPARSPARSPQRCSARPPARGRTWRDPRIYADSPDCPARADGTSRRRCRSTRCTDGPHTNPGRIWRSSSRAACCDAGCTCRRGNVGIRCCGRECNGQSCRSLDRICCSASRPGGVWCEACSRPPGNAENGRWLVPLERRNPAWESGHASDSTSRDLRDLRNDLKIDCIVAWKRPADIEWHFWTFMSGLGESIFFFF